MEQSNKRPSGTVKRPVQKRAHVEDFLTGDAFGNELEIPASIKKAMEEKQLKPRFVSYKKMHQNAGYHPKEWQVVDLRALGIKYENPLTKEPESIFRKGDLVLAYKPEEAYQYHKSVLALRAARSSKDVERAERITADLLRKTIKDADADSTHASVSEGYDE